MHLFQTATSQRRMDDLDSLNTPASSDGQAQMDLITMMMQMEEKLTDFNDLPPPPPPPPPTQPFYDAWSDATAAQMAAVTPPDRSSSVAAMREMIFRIAAMQPINIDPEAVKPPKRRNVRISKDPQSVAARHRRERISERIRILQRLVPGGTKMDTASMLDEAVHYVKFLKTQVQSLESAAAGGIRVGPGVGVGFPPAAAMAAFANGSYSCTGRGYPAQDQGTYDQP